MSNVENDAGSFIYSFVALDEFKSVMGIDDREDRAKEQRTKGRRL